MGFKLRKYQEEDIKKWIRNNFRGALYWDPGLGKTFTMAVIARRLLKKEYTSKLFIGFPAVAGSTWYEFLTEVVGIPESMIYNCMFKEHEKRGYRGEKIIMCNYQKLPPPPTRKKKTHRVTGTFDEYGKLRCELLPLRNNRKIREFPDDIDTWFLDESHMLKEHDSIAFLFFQRHIKKGDKVLMASGTPFPNRHVSAYGQLTLLEPGIVGKDISEFRREFCVCINKQFDLYAVTKDKVSVLESKIAHLCSFKTAEEHLDIPELTTSELVYQASPEQLKFISQIIRDGKVKVLENGETSVMFKTPNIAHTMGQQALSGYVDMNITSQFDRNAKENVRREFGGGNKFEVLKSQLELLKGRKVLIWVNFTETSARLKVLLQQAGYKVDRFAASDKKNYMERIKAFTDGDTQILVSHPSIIGTAVNYFSGIQYMIWYELTWDWAVYEQAVTRIYRGGQKNRTFCWHMIGHRLEKRQLNALVEKEDVHDSLTRLDMTNIREDGF